MDYRKNRIAHLEKYAQSCSLFDKVGKVTEKKTYWHVLKPIGEKRERVIKYNILEGVAPDLLKSLQRDADHLNSSQIMCYNFFRPLMDNNKKLLIELLSRHGIAITENAQCDFEYNPKDTKDKGNDGRQEKTEFDFHIIDDVMETEVFFEIKYTEQAIGRWSKESASLDNFRNFYEPMLPLCCALKTEIDFNDRFIKDYQLFRNTLRVRNDKQYSIFIYPKANKRIDKQFDAFKRDFVTLDSNIQKWYWEDLYEGKENTEFYRKYLEQ